MLKWKKEFSVNIKEIDNQHKKIIEIVNKLNDMINSKKTENANTIINSLNDFADEHFTTEEKYFDKFNYENSKEHKSEHKIFRKKIKYLKKEIVTDHLKGSFMLLDFLEDWIVDHLNEQDKKYIECFHSHGIH